MTIITITVFIIAITLFVLSIISLSKRIEKNKFPEQQNAEDDNLHTKLNQWDIFLIIISGLLIIFSISAPFIFTRTALFDDFDFTKTGTIGDTIGGLMSPFINLSAVIVTGLAFYMQYRANKLQVDIFKNQLKKTQEQFKIEQDKQDKNHQKQQFESQFYEMLRLHKENVNEIEIDAKKKAVEHEEKKMKGMGDTSKEVEYRYYYKYTDYLITKRNAFVQMQNELEFMIAKLELSDTPTLSFEKFQEIYEIYFWGLKGYVNLADTLPDDNSTKFEAMLYKIQANQYSKKSISFDEDLPFDIPAFRGHSNFLGHYYRHLFHTVKFVVDYNGEIVTNDEKKNYLRLLRAQLSNHEQALLFYNWLAKYGGAWQDDNNNFLTDYRMIHNLWYGDLPQKPFIMKKLLELVTKYKQLGHKDNLFEMGDSKILNS